MVAGDGAIERNNYTDGASGFLVLLRRSPCELKRYIWWRANKTLAYLVRIVPISNV